MNKSIKIPTFLEEDMMQLSNSLLSERDKVNIYYERKKHQFMENYNISKDKLDEILAKNETSMEQAEKELYNLFIEFVPEEVPNGPREVIEASGFAVMDKVVSGDVKIEEVHIAREGIDAASRKDPVENSPMQFFDNLVQRCETQVRIELNISESEEQLDLITIDFDVSGPLDPMEQTSVVENSITALELSMPNSTVATESQEACKSYMLAKSMSNAEKKIKKCQEVYKQQQEQNESMGEAAAVVGAFNAPNQTGSVAPQPAESIPVIDETIKNQGQPCGFKITNTSFDVSFLPSDDPSIYKPLEIVSYMGITNNVPV